ncbi:MAG TPA: LON peptidase substrate-binding domain-containing protein [Pirellulales bacterium]|jgi:ATP-dependent Lon protease|nr:LON peptidase substrate-binding domain-containing protein [Pirellulales bacterium]
MSGQPDELSFRPEEFSGVARLFPLPNLVLYPHVLQPLHVFEPRYCELVDEALAGDKLVAMCVLSPGWEPEYEGRPAVAPVACLGRITTYHRLEGGHYNILLVGLKRVMLLGELPPDKSFREAEVEIIDDRYPPEGLAQRHDLQRQLLDEFKRLLPQGGSARESLEQLLAVEVPLGVLADLVAYSINLDLKVKQELLAVGDVDRRAATLLAELHKISHADRGPLPRTGTFPPEFSNN